MNLVAFNLGPTTYKSNAAFTIGRNSLNPSKVLPRGISKTRLILEVANWIDLPKVTGGHL